MFETNVHAKRTVKVDASAERVWSLLSSVGIWRCSGLAVHAFDVTGSPAGVGHLTCMLRQYATTMGCHALETVELVPGQRVVVESRTTKPVGKEVYTFTMAPKRGAVAVTIAAEQKAVRRDRKVNAQVHWTRELKTWAEAIKNELEVGEAGRTSSWPATTTLAWITPAAGDSWEEVAGTVLIKAPVEQVWETLYEPQTSVRVDPATEYAGHVPGTPQRAIGEIQYTIHRHDGGQQIPVLALVTELVDGERATVRPHRTGIEIDQAVRPTPDGTELTLRFRWPASEIPGVAGEMSSNLDKQLLAYKTVIEADAAARQERED